ncbi:transcription antitermination factor NusB [Virgibacillus halodenitrificans]|jgi:transcription antitermination protein NusB|uniref:Transcription antitermination protein NusB n=1 Tax=Virgibacillus halodenitrificans TaxID=1482 RepID=A0AAC9NKA1_VIRHA|nr:transcription antitermination factor NusB [Virgibacillus halodenitrificans]APC48337.1 transcription antitermination factor NusB [Virgibacillus halodenitrificans]MBD1222714.1 transcription antitermination factor NusB [Virgibacillus halodenitrificans]MCG1029883.1 transcription antitermination factor NusB [Virgibacillus halodenitrificans]MCJ0930902.1 transcription antitermination factor NusB [Virgibacillus halodenitrificans]MEC2158395.1 transcription antitermination factor NusB [Virgibacillus 
MNRHTAREKAFQILFQLDINKNEPSQAINDFLETEESDPFLILLVEGVTENKQKIDRVLTERIEKWSFERIASVEKTILRIASYEIRYLDDIPTNVSINEAVELANKYGDEKSGKFINGVLSKVIIDKGE